MKRIPIYLTSAAIPTVIGSVPGRLLHDRLHRPLHDLRISVTDRCNFRCIYCMPRTTFDSDYRFLPRSDLLSFEEIYRLAYLFVKRGVRKIRITGGEPLLRKHLERLIAQLATLKDVELTLTTNGVLLPRFARTLKNAGLQRVTISLDTLNDNIFQHMNDAGYTVSQVLDGIQAAAEAGLFPLKINMVVKRGTNDHEIEAMANYFRGTGHILRFIEFMDVGNSNDWRMNEVVPSHEIITRLARYFPLEPIDPNYPGEVAQRWRYQDGKGEIGVISSVTQAFCSTCTRLRLSTEGKLYTCLFSQSGYDLRTLLRSDADDAILDQALQTLWQQREDRYSEARTQCTQAIQKIEMSYIGG